MHRSLLITAAAAALLTQAPPSSAQHESRESDPLQSVVSITIRNADLASALGRVAAASPVPIDVEVLTDAGRNPDSVLPKVDIGPEPQVLGALLVKLRKSFPALAWLVKAGRVNVTIPVDRGITDPLDDPVPTALSGTATAAEWVDRLSRQDPRLGPYPLVTEGIDSEIQYPQYTQKIKIDVVPGDTNRSVLTRVAGALGMFWSAEVADVGRAGLLRRREGKPVDLSDPDNFWCRTRIRIDWRVTSPRAPETKP